MYWREWLQSLLGLVVLLGVLEMLLPSGELAKYSKLVLGLALMLAFLQPLTILLNQDVRDLDLSWISEEASKPDVERLADNVRLAAATPFLRQDEPVLIAQMEQVLLSLDGIEEATVHMDTQGRGSTLVEVHLRPFSDTQAETVARIVGSLLTIPENRVSVMRLADTRR
jgi:stage III sporulation protein AF